MKIQVRITLPLEVREKIDAVRVKWNPERAVGNPSHVTLVYQDEAPDAELLAARLRRTASLTARFRLSVGFAARFAEPIRGAYLAVEDPTGAVRSVRERLLAPPFAARSRFGLHVTLLHPDQGERLERAWAEFAALAPVGWFEVVEFAMIGPGNETLMVVPLAEGEPGAGWGSRDDPACRGGRDAR